MSSAPWEWEALVADDQLPLLRLVRAEPLEVQAFHLSFQEFYAMREICEGGVRLPGFRWDPWWTNVVLMGVQMGDAFGNKFVEAASLQMALPGRRLQLTR